MSDVDTWSSTAASNNSASPDGFPEGMNPGGVNDSAREVMAAVARWRANLSLTPPVSTTSGSGSAGVDYTVSDWPTLVSGDVYQFRAHTASTGAANIAGTNVLLIDGTTAVAAGDFAQNGVYWLYYNGTNLLLTNPGSSLTAGSINNVTYQSIQTKTKAAFQSVTSTDAMQNDDHLIDFAIAANTNYLCELDIDFTDGAGVGGFKYQLVFTETPQSVTGVENAHDSGNNSFTSIQRSNFHTAEISVLASGSDNVNVNVKAYIVSHASNAGTLSLQWSQSNVDATATTVRQGGMMRLTQQ